MNKKYNFLKSADKTAKENNLIQRGKDLFDFSLLENLDISEEEKEYIKEDALKNVTVAFREHFYIKQFGNFKCCYGNAVYYMYAVYNEKTGEMLYKVFQLYAIKHSTGTRESIYDKYYDTKDFKATLGMTNVPSVYDLRKDIEL